MRGNIERLIRVLSIIGLAALLGAGGWVAWLPDAAGPEENIDATASAPPVIRAVTAAELRQQALAGHLAKRYRVALEPTERMVDAAYRAAEQVGLDPLLLLAVMAIESRFNPIAESVMGAKGLMQVIPKYHKHVVARHGGEEAMLEPDVNIMVGAHILKEYIQRTGNVEAGLQFYNGSLWDESTQYAGKVMAERDRIKQALQTVRVGQRI